MPTDNRSLDPATLTKFRSEFHQREANIIAMNACTRSALDEVALNRNVLASLDWNFSHEVPAGKITSQNQAGTCWLYASLNWLRTFSMKKMNVENFELSYNYLVFWDKLEKSNRFLEGIITHVDQPRHDRYVHFLLHEPLTDGGEWHMVASLIEKYGAVPKSAMADTYSLAHSALMNSILVYKLREGAATLRSMHRKGGSSKALRKTKVEILQTIYRILSILLGEPPTTFDLTFRDKKKYHRERNLTPRKFYDKWVGVDPRDYRWLMSCPTDDMPYDKTYAVDLFHNVVEAREGVFLNVPIDVLRSTSVKILKAKEPVLFGCDVTQRYNRKTGSMDTNLYDYELLFGTEFGMDKSTRIETLQVRLTHSMVLIGMDLVNGRPQKWKIENSWGEDVGHKGIFQMSDRWFEEYVLCVLTHRKYLSKPMLKSFDTSPMVLPPWHPVAC